MTLLYGYDEGAERMRAEKITPNKMVAIDHDFYTNNHKAKARKDKEVYDCIHEPKGDEVGIRGNTNPNKFAIGGVIKERRGFYK